MRAVAHCEAVNTIWSWRKRLSSCISRPTTQGQMPGRNVWVAWPEIVIAQVVKHWRVRGLELSLRIVQGAAVDVGDGSLVLRGTQVGAPGFRVASIQIGTGCTGTPCASTTTKDGAWPLTPIAATCCAETAAAAHTVLNTWQVACHQCSGSCLAQPAGGKFVGYS